MLIAGIILACWFGFSRYYTEVGKKQCQDAARTAAEKLEGKTRPIAQQADKANEAAVQDVAKDQADAGKEIHYVYRDRIKTVPVAAGSCVHPMDDRVQAELEAALQRANGGAK